MNISQISIVVAIVVFVVIATLIFVIGKKRSEKRLTPLASLAFAFVLAGILLGDNRLIGYGSMGVGVFLAIIDIFKKWNRIV